MMYNQLLNQIKSRSEEIKRVFAVIRKKKPRDLDHVFHTAHNKAFNRIDCLNCANCCKTTSPIFRDVDIARISKVLRVSSLNFEQQYLRRDEENDWVLKTSPCTFLNEDNTCFIYDIRPQACREYPHTDRKRMVQILQLTEKNTEVCPAVAEVVSDVIDHYRGVKN